MFGGGAVMLQRARMVWPPPYLGIAATVVAAVMVSPLVYLLVQSADASREAWELLLRERTLLILWRSFALVAVVTAASVAIAVPLAWLTARCDLPLRRMWTVLTLLPLVMPSYVGAFVVIVVLGPRGMLQGWLAPLGVERLPEIYGLPGAALCLTALSYPYVMLPVRSAFVRMDPALEESARMLGDSATKTFFRTTLPLLRPAIGGGALLVGLYALSDFGAVSLLRYETFTWAIFLQYESFNRELAATLSLVLAGSAFAILVLEAQTRGAGRYYRIGVGAASMPRLVSLGRWRWPAVGFCGSAVLLGLLMPMGVLLYWVVRGLAAGETLGPVWEITLNSAYVSVLAAVVAVAVSLPIAVLAVRRPGLWSGLLERCSYTGFALPGIVVALSLVFFGLRVAPALYQTMGLLVLAYVVLFLPVALGPIRASLLQVSPRLEEAARTMGRSPSQAAWTVVLPLIRPALLAAGALVFLVTMKELPATLILSPVGFKTLGTATWSAASEAFFARAAAPALLLVAVSAVIMGLVLLPERRRRR